MTRRYNVFKHLPNILSTIRLIMVPFFPILYFSNIERAHYYALVLFIVAGLTDMADGYIARTYHLITKAGTVLDPLADKLMQLTAITCLAIDHALPYWVMVLFILKESGMIITGIYMYFRKTKTVMPANRFGKAGTVLFSFAIFVTILAPDSLFSMMVIIGALLLKLTALGSYMHLYFTKIKPTIQ